MAKGIKGSSPKPEDQPIKTTFIIQRETKAKFDYIAFVEQKEKTEIIEELLTDLISKWEKKNGPIPLRKKKG